MLTRVRGFFQHFWTHHHQQVKDSAMNTLIVVFIVGVLSLFLAFADGPGKNITVVAMMSSSLKNISQQAFDTVNFVQSGMATSGKTDQKVFLIDLDQQTVQQAATQQATQSHCEFQDLRKCEAQGMPYFNRNALAGILSNLSRFPEKPQAVFIDLDLSYPDPYSDGKALVQALKAAPYPVFLPVQKPSRAGTFVLDGRVYPMQQFPSLCFVDHHLLLDEGDFKVRQLANPTEGRPSVAEALYRVGRGEQVKTPDRICNAAGQPASANMDVAALVYKRLDRSAELQAWEGLEVRKGTDFLSHPADQHLFDSGLVLIGRTDPDNADNYYTPISSFLKTPTSGVEVHVTSLMNLLSYNHFGKSVGGIYVLLFAAVTLFVLQLAATLLIDSAFKLKNLFGDFLEIVMVWLLMLIPAAAILHAQGYFLDYTLPLVALYLLRTFMKLRNPEDAPSNNPEPASDPPENPTPPEEARA